MLELKKNRDYMVKFCVENVSKLPTANVETFFGLQALMEIFFSKVALFFNKRLVNRMNGIIYLH